MAMFAQSIRAASASFLEDPLGSPLIPNWNRVQSALPDFFRDMREAVRLDNEERKFKPLPSVASKANVEFSVTHPEPVESLAEV